MEQLFELLELMEQGRMAELRNRLSEMNAVDIAEFFENLEKERALVVFRILPKDLAVDVFSYMSTDQQQHIVESITDREVRTLVDGLFLDDTVDFLEEVPANVVKKVLKNTDEGTRRLINQFLRYPENSAGSKMTIEFVELPASTSAGSAIDIIRKTGVDKETVYTCYVIDERRKLLGAVALHSLLVSPDAALVGDLMDDVTPAHTMDDQEQVADMARKYDLLAVPVVDNEERLVGIITVDDLMDVIEEENTEDIEKMAALSPSEDTYLRTGVLALAKNRVVWLLILMVSGTLSGLTITRFENVISHVLVLASFIPVLMDSGGNAGSQSATLIIRGMALGEIQLSDFARVLYKELRVSLLCASVLAAVNFARLLVFSSGVSAPVAAVMSLALMITVIAAKLIGCMLPMLARLVRVDPALMASPLITTIVDVLALLVYFSLAVAILHVG